MKDGSAAQGPSVVGRVRWGICALIFFGTMINYIDRHMISVLKPTLQGEFGWSEQDYADIIFSFQLAYAFGYVIFGYLMDSLGARVGYSIAAVTWGLATMAHAAAGATWHFMLARVMLGFGEAGNFPASVKAVTEWFPKKERALGIGIITAGANIGAILTPMLAAFLVPRFGWRPAFLIVGLIVFVWLVFWIGVYRPPRSKRNLSPSELDHIESDGIETPQKVAWLPLLRHRQTWAFAMGKFLLDPTWWFFMFWLPGFFVSVYGLNLAMLSVPLAITYIMTDAGGIGGGWLSSHLIKRGWSANVARKATMLACSLCVLPVVFAPVAGHRAYQPYVLLIGLAMAGHQGFAVNLLTLPSDLFPARAVGAVTGIGGTLGALGGMAMAKFTGWMLQEKGDYVMIFAVAALNHLIGLLIIHLLVPKFRQAKLA